MGRKWEAIPEIGVNAKMDRTGAFTMKNALWP